MTNSNYVKTHGVLIQGNNIQAKETDGVTKEQQIALIKRILDDYFYGLENKSLVALNCEYIITFFDKSGNYASDKCEVILNYYDKLIATIKRLNKIE